MKLIFLILPLIVAVHAADWDYGVCGRFQYELSPGTNSFYDIPGQKYLALLAGWIETDRYDGAPMASLTMACSPEYNMCALYDDTGYIAGNQICMLAENFSGAIYDWATLGFTNWTTSVNGTSKSFWCISAFYCTEETLAKSSEERLAERAVRNVTLQEDILVLEGFNKELMQINSNASDITNTTLFTKQACFPWMGHHYFYNMSTTTVCSQTTMYPWFLLMYSNEIIGMGVYVFGNYTVNSGERNWFESPGETGVKMIVPNGPQCMYDTAGNPGVVTSHVYFVKKPWYITCIFED